MNIVHKKMNISTVVSIIAIWNFLFGTTTKFFLDFLHKTFPAAKIYCLPEELSESEESDKESVDFDVDGFYENDDKSIGAITKMEKFDEDILQKYLRKHEVDEEDDPLGVYAADNDNGPRKSLADGSSFHNAGLPKHRQSIMHNRNIPIKTDKSVTFSMPIPDTSNQADPNFLSPGGAKGGGITRRSTITHNKVDSSMLRKLSVMNVSPLFVPF